MPRIPDTPIGLVIRESRFAAISVGATSVMVSLSELHASYELLHAESATSPMSTIIPDCKDELQHLMGAVAERIAILKGISTDEARAPVEGAATDGAGTGPAAGQDLQDVMKRLSSLERHLRTLIERTRKDPPTHFLYVKVLAEVERQQWRLEQGS